MRPASDAFFQLAEHATVKIAYVLQHVDELIAYFYCVARERGL